MTRIPHVRIPDWLVEKVHLGEASDAERALVQADPDALARLESLPTQDARFFAQLPLEQEWPKIEAKARIARARDEARANRVAVGSVIAAPLLAALLALLWVGPMPTPRETTDPGYEGPKGPPVVREGPPKLRVYRKRTSGPERLNSGSVARKGDLLQLETVAANPQHGVVVSVDGRGAVTLHWPSDPGAATELEVGAKLLPDAYTLDDAPKFERFFLVTTGVAPTDVSTVVHAAEALAASGDAQKGDLAVPRSYDQTSFLVVKEVQ